MGAVATTEIKLVPNQKGVIVNKAPADKNNLYTINNLSAIDEAAFSLQEKGSFKLYIYLAKNQNNYKFALSSSHFMEWSGLSKQAYDTAVKELIAKGYLVPIDGKKQWYNFYERVNSPALNPSAATAGFNF